MGTEVITYSRIGKEDIRFGKGTFEVVLADGRKAIINEVDVGAILNDATLSSPFSSYWIDVQADPYNAAADGTTDDGDAIEAALDAAEVTGGTVFFRTGTYAYATSPNFARVNVNIIADRGAVFHHTGTGNAFTIDGGATGTGIRGNRYENITVQGNANSTHGLYVRSIHSSRFVHPSIKGCSTTGHAIHVEWGLLNLWDTPRVSANDGTLSPLPLHGIYLTRRTSDNESTTTQTILNPVMEGLTASGGYGIYFDYTGTNTVVGGTSEGNYGGLYFSANGGTNNRIAGMDLESNTFADVVVDGIAMNRFEGMMMSSTGGLKLTGLANRNYFSGRIDNMTVDATAHHNTFQDVTFVGTRTDNSTLGNSYSHWGDASGFQQDKTPNNIVATASLPGASAAMDGTILIEDAAVGDRNLILYAGGQRFRIDGGSAI